MALDSRAHQFSASKNNIIREQFVRSADENYITARWCAANQIHLDFLWLAVHALEKYLKAALLSNDRSAKNFGHDIVALYDAVKECAAELLPSQLTKPRDLSIHHWRDETPEQFLGRLLRNGNAENRYLVFGYSTSGDDLHKLDAMVFAVRRLACSLEERHMPASAGADAPTSTNRQWLATHPEQYRRLGMPLDELVRSTEDSPKRTAALNLNLPFAPANFDHGSLRGGSSARNPVLIRGVLDPLRSSDTEVVMQAIELASWFVDNVQVSRDIARQLSQAVAEAKSRNGLE